jgi:TRAP-type mannitol/chloroaromatic compound transport system permease large subunit
LSNRRWYCPGGIDRDCARDFSDDGAPEPVGDAQVGYDTKLAIGTICASVTLGQVIPPFIVLVLLDDISQGASTQAQLARGNFAPDSVAVVDLFAGAFSPVLLLVGLYVAWILFKGLVDPKFCPALVDETGRPDDMTLRFFKVLLPPPILIILVLGSILVGTATPTESAAVVAVEAMVLVVGRGQFNLDILREVMRSTLSISSMVFVILLGASTFSLTFRGVGGDDIVDGILKDTPRRGVRRDVCRHGANICNGILSRFYRDNFCRRADRLTGPAGDCCLLARFCDVVTKRNLWLVGDDHQ